MRLSQIHPDRRVQLMQTAGWVYLVAIVVIFGLMVWVFWLNRDP